MNNNKSKKSKVSKKEMKQKVKEVLGSDTEDEYKPDKSEQSEDDFDAAEEDEISEDEQSNADSDISNVLLCNSPKKSKYFQRSSGSIRQVERKSNINLSNLAKAKVTKNGGCTFNSIGIEKFGTPQSDLLKQKIANYKIPAFQEVPLTSKSMISNQQESAFGNGSCIAELLKHSRLTKPYEKFKKQHIIKIKNKENVDEKDFTNILQEFEKGTSNAQEAEEDECSSTKSSSKSKSKKELDEDSDTDDDDFEEVENAHVDDDFDDYKPECLKEGVTIQVKDALKSNRRNVKKNVDWIYDAIRLGINRQRKEICVNTTKVSVLSSLARVKYLNELTFDQEIQALAYSTDFFKNLKTKSINDAFVKKFIGKFKDTFKFNYVKDRSQLQTSRAAIEECFQTSQTNHPTIYNLIFLILFRTYCKLNSIEENSRLCIAFKPIDFKCDDLINKPKKGKQTSNQKKSTVAAASADEDDFISNDEEDEKPTKKSNAKNKKPTTASSKKVGKGKKKPKSEEEDDDFSEEEVKPKSTKGKQLTKKPAAKSKKEEKVIVTKEMQLNKKNLIELWTEIYLPDKNVWSCYEPIDEVYYAEDLESKFYVNPFYVLSFNSNHHFKDLTSKYVANYFLHKFKRLRLEDDWLDSIYSVYRPAELTKDEADEEERIREAHLDKPLPKSVAEFKNHGLYFLERHLLKYQVIYPLDAPVVGKLNNKEKIYLTDNIHSTHSKEYWKKEARQVKEDEEPAKVIILYARY